MRLKRSGLEYSVLLNDTIKNRLIPLEQMRIHYYLMPVFWMVMLQMRFILTWWWHVTSYSVDVIWLMIHLKHHQSVRSCCHNWILNWNKGVTLLPTVSSKVQKVFMHRRLHQEQIKSVVVPIHIQILQILRSIFTAVPMEHIESSIVSD